MKKILLTMMILCALALTSNGVWAHGEDTLTEAEHLVIEQVPCDNLSEGQLEMIGDYYMEQMHPGDAHEQMDAMMGGEGSETLKQMHINMAKRLYCGDTSVAGCSMMQGGKMGSNMMGDKTSMMHSGMMSGGMMSGGMMGSSMMGDVFSGGSVIWGVLGILLIFLFAALLVFVILGIVKLAKVEIKVGK